MCLMKKLRFLSILYIEKEESFVKNKNVRVIQCYMFYMFGDNSSDNNQSRYLLEKYCVLSIVLRILKCIIYLKVRIDNYMLWLLL